MGDEQEVRARHILIRAPANDEKASKEAEDKVKAVIARLNKGEDFAKLAGELTEDPSGKANGESDSERDHALPENECANVARRRAGQTNAWVRHHSLAACTRG